MILYIHMIFDQQGYDSGYDRYDSVSWIDTIHNSNTPSVNSHWSTPPCYQFVCNEYVVWIRFQERNWLYPVSRFVSILDSVVIYFDYLPSLYYEFCWFYHAPVCWLCKDQSRNSLGQCCWVWFHLNTIETVYLSLHLIEWYESVVMAITSQWWLCWIKLYHLWYDLLSILIGYGIVLFWPDFMAK